jgi:NAD(P)-dependent dehydrogenase (short-subunit alcohol dehydrogenase family)
MNERQQSILITGCSKGFGLLFAKNLAQKGHIVYAGVRDLASAPELTQAANSISTLTAIKLDVNNADDIQAVIQHIQEQGHGLDALINNAGYGLIGKVADLDHSKLVTQFETNVFSIVRLSQACLPMLNASEAGGLVVNISSIASYLGLPGFGAYSASKVALNSLSMSLAIENSEKNLSVVLIEPGPFKTEFRQSAEKASEVSSYAEKRSKLFPTQEDPQEVVELIESLIQKKANKELPNFKEIPIGKNSNLLRIISRWLPQELLAKFVHSQT